MQAFRRPLLSIPSLTRGLHHAIVRTRPPTVPRATTVVPDVPTFLNQIGRQCEQHAPKFESWDHFFKASSEELKNLGIEPARTRRYIIRWREHYRQNDGNIKLHQQRRGHKVDGGERKRKEVRAKRYQEERKKAAEEASAM
ncbi:hypothetical protein EX30DRAFT_331525 [Ascodesmis nigricans]|uniref:Small ribosomal subunit protein mS41 n=1 Tax=Ascodesmis nigricans TaxID=341454 RepID=A0A4S2MWW5_9PEZI|nr:hypothetical protein EX30DRAFT_331525 [Ascodesmis nigricans]